MNNSAIYDRFIDMFLESADDFEPYGAIDEDSRDNPAAETIGAGDGDAIRAGELETEY